MTIVTEADYVSAQEAADLLGVSVTTLYVYVGRKGLRSQRISGSRARRYWRADIERLRSGEPRRVAGKGEVRRESAITLITERGPYYRGRSAVDLAESASLEEVAALLWDVRSDVFSDETPRIPAEFDAISSLLGTQGTVGRAAALFHLLEEADPRSHDLSAGGMARTGVDVMRALTALVLRNRRPSSRPIHLQAADSLGLDENGADLVRRLLVLSADHGFEPGAYAVRAVASTGVSPWRCVGTGLSVLSGRRSGFGRFHSLSRLLTEVLESPDPKIVITRRLREGEAVPGFDSHLYAEGDPRAQALLAKCRSVFQDDLRLHRLDTAIETMMDARGACPDFALASGFVGRCIGMDPSDSFFLVGRSAGWIAHSIEQYATGEAEHREGRYSGMLPAT